MLRSAAVSRIAEGLGFRADLETTIISRLQESQRLLEKGKTLPRFLLLEDQSLSLAADGQDVALPTGFLRQYEDEPIRYTESATAKKIVVLRKTHVDAIEAYSDAADGPPKVYVLRASTIRFYPIADINYTLTWSYYKAADLLDTDIENAWLEHASDWLIGDAGERLAKDLRDADAVEVFAEMKVRGREAVFVDDIALDLADRPLVMGGAN